MTRRKETVKHLTMYSIDRAVALIKPKQPYLNWANSLPDPTPITLEELRKDGTAILVSEPEYKGDAETYIREIYLNIFEMELDAWHRDKRLWPSKRDYKTFTEWFDVEIYEIVIDSSEGEIKREVY